jgi:hypothetical protein
VPLTPVKHQNNQLTVWIFKKSKSFLDLSVGTWRSRLLKKKRRWKISWHCPFKTSIKKVCLLSSSCSFRNHAQLSHLWDLGEYCLVREMVWFGYKKTGFTTNKFVWIPAQWWFCSMLWIMIRLYETFISYKLLTETFLWNFWLSRRALKKSPRKSFPPPMWWKD